MAIDSDILQVIKRKKFEDVESTWIARIESVPRNYAWFLEVAREMRGAKANAQVSDLLALLIDTLASEKSWEDAFNMISEGVSLVPRQKSIREKAIEVIRLRYAHRPDLVEILSTFGIETSEDLAATFADLRDWLRFEIGAGFFLFGRGLGRVVETNLALQKVKIKFEKATPLVVRRDEARKLLTWLPPEHFMMKRLDDPQDVHRRALAEPEEVLRELLTLFKRPLTAAEIRECMTGIVEGSQWTSWWNRAKGHPQVLMSRERKNAFFWSESSEAADVSILNEFKTAPFEKKLELARRHAKRGGGVKEEIVQRLLEELGSMAQGPAADALEIVFLLEELQGLPAAAVRSDRIHPSRSRSGEGHRAGARPSLSREDLHRPTAAATRRLAGGRPGGVFRRAGFPAHVVSLRIDSRAGTGARRGKIGGRRRVLSSQVPARVRVGCEKCAFSSGIARSDEPQPDLEDSGFARRPGVQGIEGTAS